jgi:hypothetical protein
VIGSLASVAAWSLTGNSWSIYSLGWLLIIVWSLALPWPVLIFTF